MKMLKFEKRAYHSLRPEGKPPFIYIPSDKIVSVADATAYFKDARTNRVSEPDEYVTEITLNCGWGCTQVPSVTVKGYYEDIVNYISTNG